MFYWRILNTIELVYVLLESFATSSGLLDNPFELKLYSHIQLTEYQQTQYVPMSDDVQSCTPVKK